MGVEGDSVQIAGEEGLDSEYVLKREQLIDSLKVGHRSQHLLQASQGILIQPEVEELQF